MSAQTPDSQESSHPAGDAGVLFGHAFSANTTIPAGNWMLSIVKGEAWVFCGEANFVLRAGDYALLAASDGPITIRSLYTKGFALYRAAPLRVNGGG